jgi:hypothetical protein
MVNNYLKNQRRNLHIIGECFAKPSLACAAGVESQGAMQVFDQTAKATKYFLPRSPVLFSIPLYSM